MHTYLLADEMDREELLDFAGKNILSPVLQAQEECHGILQELGLKKGDKFFLGARQRLKAINFGVDGYWDLSSEEKAILCLELAGLTAEESIVIKSTKDKKIASLISIIELLEEAKQQLGLN